ncbi:MAG: glutathione S-transferase C-terminal domain-containing protein [Mastigocoleus sp.]
MLKKQLFITGDEFTVADIVIASYLYYARLLLSLDFSKYPAVVTYLDKIAKRPAFKNTLGKR